MPADLDKSATDDHSSAKRITLVYAAALFVIVGIFAAIEWVRRGGISSAGLIGWLLFGVGVAVLVIPAKWLPSEPMTGRQLQTEHPQLAWARWVFPVLQLACFSLLLWVFFTPYTPFDMTRYLELDGGRKLLGATLAASLAALTGLFASLTGLYPELIESKGYRFTRGDEARNVGRMQFILALGTMVTALAILVF
jgi:hypothetical protein